LTAGRTPFVSEESAISRNRRRASSANSINAAQVVQRFFRWEILFRKLPRFYNISVGARSHKVPENIFQRTGIFPLFFPTVEN